MASLDSSSQIKFDSNRVHLAIVTPEGCAFSGQADLVELPSVSGELGIFPGHAPLFAEVGAGEIRIHLNGQYEAFAVAGGYVQVNQYAIRILAHFVSAGEDEARIEEACQRAKDALEMADDLSPERIASELTALRMEMLRVKKSGKR